MPHVLHAHGPAHSIEDQLVRQLHAIDAWNSFRRQRESLLARKPASRDEKALADGELDMLRYTHAALLDRTGLALARAAEATSASAPTVVIAHRGQWFADQLGEVLRSSGVHVLHSTSNGATALGVLIAEQPDFLIASDRLGMISTEQLLAATAWHSPITKRVVHAEEGPQPHPWLAASLVFNCQHRPAEVAEALVSLHHEMSPA